MRSRRPRPSSATARSAGARAPCSLPSPEQFHLETSRDDIAVYTFRRHVVRHQFCKTCGCAPFAEGTGPGGKAMVVINLRCADNVDLSTVRIAQFDGASL